MSITTKDIKNRQRLLRLAKKHNVLRVGSAVKNLSTEDAVEIIKIVAKHNYELPEKYYHLLK